MGRCARPMAMVVLACCSTLVTSCYVEATLPPAHAPNPPAGPPSKLLPGAANGAPADVKPSVGNKLWIWREQDGMWRIRSTTKNSRHKYRGRVVGETSHISWVQPELVEAGDAMTHHGGELIFEFDTAGHIDGVNFVSDDRRCVTFHITVDEKPQPQFIFIGASGANPPTDHFTLCP